MVQGTGSGVGKSFLAAALCRLFARAGYRVAPFKSQNMALNAAVTPEGGEIGRAQAAQAEAAGLEPSVDMNPILLKPESDHRCQVVVHGRARATVDFAGYELMKPALLPLVVESLERLRGAYDLVVIEGAGSPAEINLQAGEIVNMTIARLAEAPVLLVGDIDRGGIFAAFVGTLALLDAPDRARIAGFVVNKFRGDRGLLTPGLEMLMARTGVPVLGVVPYLAERLVPAEDSLDLAELARAGEAASAVAGGSSGPVIEVAVVRLPRISNFDDFEPLAAEPRVRLRLAGAPGDLGSADLIVLPGSKSTIADLQWLEASGVGASIRSAAAAGRPVLGICGGYQMLGAAIHDPEHVESPLGTVTGLGLLPVVTTFTRDKRTVRVRARVTGEAPLFGAAAGELVAYEIHAGRTRGAGDQAPPAPPFTVTERAGGAVAEPDGASDPTGRIVGTYLHGLFENTRLRRALLESLAAWSGKPGGSWGLSAGPRARYDRLAEVVGASLDISTVSKLVGLGFPKA